MAASSEQKQVNIRVESNLYHTLETIARQEHRSVPQTARLLLEEGLRQRTGSRRSREDIPATDLAVLAKEGGAFDWLEDEPDIYDDSCGEPL